MRLNPNQIPWTRGEPIDTGTQVIRRIKAGATREEMENLKDLLEDELEGPVKDLSCSLREEGSRVVGESAWGYIERLADQVDSILTKAWAVTLDQVGEEVTVGSPPPKRRLNQRGHIRRAIGKKYKLLLKQESTLRRVHRKVVQCVENAGGLTTGLEQEVRGILNVPQNGEVGHSNATPSELQDRLREALTNS